jgi:hypothetical protein
MNSPFAALAFPTAGAAALWACCSFTTEAIASLEKISVTTSSLGGGADAVSGVVMGVTETFDSFVVWIAQSVDRAPALVLVLLALIALPPLAFLGLLFKSQSQRSPDATYIQTRSRGSTRREDDDGGLTERAAAWPSEAWIEVEGAEDAPHKLRRGVVRIGRESDNDICLSDKTVHRYHAAIHRSDTAEYIITDLSSADGNGVAVNGERLVKARLHDGDVIELGLARLKFVAKPA